ncbi:MAG: hypothetical protein ABFS45_12165 [Pseudomonadota bacterium]
MTISLKQQRLSIGWSDVWLAALLLVPFAAQALPVSPNLEGAFTTWFADCASDFDSSDPNPAFGVSGGGCSGENPSSGNTWDASAQSDVGRFGSDEDGWVPITGARAATLSIATSNVARAEVKFAYGFSITSTGAMGTPMFFEVPMAITANASVEKDVNAGGSAIVIFRRGSYIFDGSNFIPAPFTDNENLFVIEAATNVLDPTDDFDSILWTDLITTDTPYWFNLIARCTSFSTPEPTAASCTALADPIIEFDQVAFDAMMGEDTFSLADEFQIQFSPSFENVVIPLPPAVWLFGSGLLGLVGIARQRKAT